MSTIIDHDQRREARRQVDEPRTDRAVPEAPEGTGAPEAVLAERVARHSRSGQEARRARGVDWVRPSDLLARQSATLAGRGIDFDVELARRARKLTSHVTRATGRSISRAGRVVSERARRLPDVSEFGRGSRPDSWVSRSGIGLG